MLNGHLLIFCNKCASYFVNPDGRVSLENELHSEKISLKFKAEFPIHFVYKNVDIIGL